MLGYRVLGYRVLQVQGYQVLQVQGYRVLQVQGYQVLQVQGYRVLQVQGYQVPQVQDYRVLLHRQRRDPAVHLKRHPQERPHLQQALRFSSRRPEYLPVLPRQRSVHRAPQGTFRDRRELRCLEP